MSLLRSGSRRERQLLLLAVVLAVVVRVAYVVATKDHTLVGDEPEYDLEARFLAGGDWFFSTTPFGDPHQTTWKAPGYGTFLGLLYLVLGSGVDKALLAQSVLLAPLTIGLTFLLGRRLLGSEVGLLAALVVAVYPGTWQYDVRLYSEALANPLTVLALIGLLTGRRRPALLGAVIGACLLVRPSSLFLLAAAAAAYWATGGLRTGTRQLATTVGVAVLVVAPWSIRNATLEGPWVPISVQSAALYGTFNDDAANDEDLPYKWRPLPARDRELFDPENRITDGELYQELTSRPSTTSPTTRSPSPTRSCATGCSGCGTCGRRGRRSTTPRSRAARGASPASGSPSTTRSWRWRSWGCGG